MFKKNTVYTIGAKYRVAKLLVSDRQSRDALIALGLIPGEVVQIVRSMFWGRYWIICIQEQMIGLRVSELQWLQLHVISH